MNSKIAVGVLIFLFGIINSLTSSRLVDAAPTDFLGTWVNVDQETRGLTALNIVLGAAGFEVQGFGQCHPTDCDWGFTALNFPDDTRGEAVWDFGFSETTLVIHLEGDQLAAETYTIFKDDSGRPNYRALYLMRRSQPDSGLPPDPGDAGVVSVPGTANWIDTQVDVVEGDLLAITATGLWTEGDTTNGPDGIEQPWPDNFFNFADIGVCMDCAQTATAHWGALIGYIGSSPPAAGSYTSTAVFQEATKVFYVGGNYEASAPASGRLWLNKNTDAYSNYTVDNGGQVEATIEVSPPETDIEYTNRAHVAAASINALEPLREARDFCIRAVADHIRDEGLKYWIKEALGKDLEIFVDPNALLIQVVGDSVKIQYRASNGQWANATWDFGRLIYRLLSEIPIPRFQLFGIVGVPALDCTMAGFWLTGKLGGQLGRLIREKLQPPSTVDASIAGAWTLERSAPITCINFSKGCLSAPIHVRVYDCTATQCTISRSDGDWQLAHPITRRGATWSADFEDIGVECNGNLNVARIVLRFSVTTSEGNQAKSVGGFYKVQAASNPPDCAGNARARYLLYGSR
jgi:hypothetical protein